MWTWHCAWRDQNDFWWNTSVTLKLSSWQINPLIRTSLISAWQCLSHTRINVRTWMRFRMMVIDSKYIWKYIYPQNRAHLGLLMDIVMVAFLKPWIIMSMPLFWLFHTGNLSFKTTILLQNVPNWPYRAFPGVYVM